MLLRTLLRLRTQREKGDERPLALRPVDLDFILKRGINSNSTCYRWDTFQVELEMRYTKYAVGNTITTPGPRFKF